MRLSLVMEVISRNGGSRGEMVESKGGKKSKGKRRSRRSTGGGGGRKSFAGWVRRIVNAKPDSAGAARLEERRRGALHRARVLDKKPNTTQTDECTTGRTNQDASVEQSEDKSLDQNSSNPFTVMRFMEEAAVDEGAPLLPSPTITVDWDPWADLKTIEARDAEFATEMVKMNTAANLMQVQQTDEDGLGGLAVKKEKRKIGGKLAPLTELFRRKRQLRIQPKLARTMIVLDDDGRVIKEQTSEENVKVYVPRSPTAAPQQPILPPSTNGSPAK